VEPRSAEGVLLELVARAGAAPPLVEAPDISLNRLVVPRVAPMLELPPELLALLPELLDPPPVPDPPNAEAPPVEDDDPVPLLPEPLLVTEVVGADEPPPPPPLLNDRPRSLRLPLICGAITEENFSAWTVPVSRMVRWTLPVAIWAVRVITVELFPEELFRVALQ
jgi:hypothetical protein